MNIDREAKKAEAVERMKALGIFPETVRQFEREDYVSVSEPPFGAFFWADGEDLQRIHENSTMRWFISSSAATPALARWTATCTSATMTMNGRGTVRT